MWVLFTASVVIFLYEGVERERKIEEAKGRWGLFLFAQTCCSTVAVYVSGMG